MEVKTVMNIDELLKDFGLDRNLMIQKDPKYQQDFDRLDSYYKRYEEKPSETVAKAVNSIVYGFVEKLKTENPELFITSETPIIDVEPVDNKFSQQKADLLFFIQQGNQDAIDDIFNEVGVEKTQRLLSYDNYKTYLTALKTRNALVISYIQEWIERFGLFPAAVIARDGAIMNQIFSNNDPKVIIKALEALNDNPQEAATVLKKINALEQAIEMGNADITDFVETLYQKYGVGKKIKEKASKVLKDDTDLKKIITDIMAGKLPLDIPLVSRLERKTALRVMNTPEEIAAGNPYRIIVQTPFFSFFEGKQIYKDENLAILEREPTDFERQFGTTVYEIAFAWYNIKNLLTTDDVLSIFFVANISTSLMVDRGNDKLRQEYKTRLKEVFTNPESNKVGGRQYQLNESNLKSLQKSGFLDNDFCPTRLFYAVMVLHAFPFPAYTHPFEFISIDTFSSLFQFQVLKGEYGNESFYTDGDILYHNFQPDANPPGAAMAFSDMARTVILNLKSNGRADIKKTQATISNFIPFLYTIPKTGLSIPTFSVKALDVQNRKINWGVYEFKAGDEYTYVNSYGVDNFLSNVKNAGPGIHSYRGPLSSEILANPPEGVIIGYDKKFVAVRGINRTSLLAENFGKNWLSYYDEMFTKPHLKTQVLDIIGRDLTASIYMNTDTKIETVNPNLTYTSKKLEAPIQLEKASKQPTVVKKQVKDNRVYIGKKQSRDELDRQLWPIYDKVAELTGDARDEAILDALYDNEVKTIFPKALVLLGFDLAAYAVSPQKVVFKDKYQLRIPNLTGYVYYLEKR